MLGICTAILVVVALYFGRAIFAPVAFALFVIALVWPTQAALQARIPRLIAMAITVTMVVVVVSALATLIGWGFSRAAHWLIADSARFQAMYVQANEWLEGHGIVLAGLFGDMFNVSWLARTLQGVALRFRAIVSFSIVALVFIILGLLEVDLIETKLRALRNKDIGLSLVRASVETASKLRKYMLVRSVMSVMTGVLVYAFAKLVGLHLAAEWGVIAFALNYIPFVGPFVATVFPTLFALAQFESWQMAIFVFGCLNIIQFVVGSYLEPRVAGNALSISPFVVLFAVFLWSFLWGIAGAFIGVPIVIAALTVCEQYPGSRWVAEMLAGANTGKA